MKQRYEKQKMEKLILRKAKLKDLDSMWNNIWQDKELAKFMLWKPVENIEEAKIRLEKTIEYLITERERIIESIRRIGTRDELEEIKVDLILNDYRTKCFKYLKKIKEKENKNKRK